MTSQIAKTIGVISIRITPIRGPLPSEIFRNEAWVHTLTVHFFGACCASCLELAWARVTLRLVCHRLVVVQTTVFTVIIQPFLSSRTVCCKWTYQLFIHWGLDILWYQRCIGSMCYICISGMTFSLLVKVTRINEGHCSFIPNAMFSGS